MVDIYCTIEEKEGSFLRQNENRLRYPHYKRLRAYLWDMGVAVDDGENRDSVRLFLLPTNFVQEVMCVRRQMLDITAISSNAGLRDILTMTIN